MRKKTQIASVLEYLQNHDDLSPLEAFGLFGTTRLASIIEDLRKEGHIIDTHMHKDINGKRYARYSYVEKTYNYWDGHGVVYPAKKDSIIDLRVAA